ncbi:MAG: PHP-associated domain-containing protein [Deltaproteobacteria bacterium]
MEMDLHIHTNRYSGCSNINPVDALVKAAEVGLDAIALTEHGIRWSEESIEELIKKSGVKNLIVFPGQEVACYSATGAFQGEFLVYGYPDSLGSNKSIEKLIPMVHALDGVVIAAHPFKKNDTGDGFYGSGHRVAEYSIDGIEAEHPSYGDEERMFAAQFLEKKKMAGIGCSDAHDLRSIGICRTIFKRQVKDVASLCIEIRECRLEAINLNKKEGK